jgi:hypothetical protein
MLYLLIVGTTLRIAACLVLVALADYTPVNWLICWAFGKSW